MNDDQSIRQLLSLYFGGLHGGDTDVLRSVFHPGAALFAAPGGERYHKTLDAYLAGVAARPSPQQLGEPFRMSVLSVDVVNNIGVAKVHVPARGLNYFNYLSLLREDGRWRIVNKVFDDVPLHSN